MMKIVVYTFLHKSIWPRTKRKQLKSKMLILVYCKETVDDFKNVPRAHLGVGLPGFPPKKVQI